MKTRLKQLMSGVLFMLLFVALAPLQAESSFERFQREDQEALRRFGEQQRQRTDTKAVLREVPPATPPAEAPVPDDPPDPAVEAEPLPDPEPANTPAVEAVLPTLPTITAWLPPPAVTNSAAYAIPEDPCAGLTLSTAIPDEPELPETPADLLATPLALSLDTLTKARYVAVVGAAHEAMRLILGEMPPDRAEVFEQRWMALYDFPSAVVVNYLDRLNPLLVEFLGLTQASETLLMDMAELQFEAEMAAAYEAEAEARSAMTQIMRAGEMLRTIKARLEGVTKAVEALGDPPDPQLAKCRTRRKFKQYTSPPESGAWVLQSNTVVTTWTIDDERVSTNAITFYTNAAIAHAVVPAKWLSSDENYPDLVIRWRFDWATGPAVLRGGEDPRGLFCAIKDAGVTHGDGRVDAKIWMLSTNHVSDLVYYDGMMRGWQEDYHINGVYQTILHEQKSPCAGGFKRHTPQEEAAATSSNLSTPLPPPLKFVPESITRLRPYGTLLEGQHGWTMVIEVRFNSAYNSGVARYYYEYDKEVIPPPPAPAWPNAPVVVAEAPATPDAESDEEKELKEKIAFHENQIGLIEDDIRRYGEMLDKIQPDDDSSRTALTYSIMTKQADLQREHDQIATLRTGNFVRTRTAFDELVRMQMQANSRELALRIKEAQYRSGAIERLTNLLPVEEQHTVRQWARRQLGDGNPDPEKLREVAAVIAGKAAGHNQAEAAQYDEVAAGQQFAIDVLENYQTAARYTMYATPFVGGGPALALAYGITSGGIDGYHTGGLLGPDHKGAMGAAVGSVTTAARYLSSHIDYGLTFYEGYSYPDETGEQGGVLGALQRVAVTFIERKAMQTVTQGLLRYQARTQAARKQAKLDAWRDAKRRVEFRQEREYGRAMVERHQQLYREHQQLKTSGAAPAAIAASEQRLMDQTAAVMHAPHAKGYLKFNASPAQQRAFNSTSRLHIKRVVREYRSELARQGYDVDSLRFQTIRNVGNTSPCMDTDIGVTSANGNRVGWTDPATGRRTELDLHRSNAAMQSAFNTVYRDMSGRRAAQHESWINITTADSLEAYRDPAWLHTGSRYQRGINPRAAIDPRHAPDAARVTEQKLNELNQGSHAPDNKLWEKFRGTAKDIDSKILPLLKQRIGETQSPQRRTQLVQRMQFYMKLRNAMNLSNHDPVAAEQAVNQLTGFHPVEAMRMTTVAIESLGKW